jgi:hypothetical protein
MATAAPGKKHSRWSWLRPTASTAILAILTWALLWAIFSSSQTTFNLDGMQARRDEMGPGPSVIVTRGPESASGRTEVEVVWGNLLLSLVVTYLAARSGALALERLSTWKSPARSLLTVVAFTLLAAGVAALGFSRVYWGYFLARPPADRLTSRFHEVSALSFVSCISEDGAKNSCVETPESTIEGAVERCGDDEYYCLRDRLVVAFSQRGLLPKTPPGVEPALVARLPHLLAATGLLVAPDPGYERYGLLGSLVVTGTDSGGTPLLLIGAAGDQVSNDHHPYYEALLRPRGDGTADLLDHNRFFYDVAGIEGMEWKAAFVLAAILGLTVTIPGAIAFGLLRGELARRRLESIR